MECNGADSDEKPSGGGRGDGGGSDGTVGLARLPLECPLMTESTRQPCPHVGHAQAGSRTQWGLLDSFS